MFQVPNGVIRNHSAHGENQDQTLQMYLGGQSTGLRGTLRHAYHFSHSSHQQQLHANFSYRKKPILLRKTTDHASAAREGSCGRFFPRSRPAR